MTHEYNVSILLYLSHLQGDAFVDTNVHFIYTQLIGGKYAFDATALYRVWCSFHACEYVHSIDLLCAGARPTYTYGQKIRNKKFK